MRRDDDSLFLCFRRRNHILYDMLVRQVKLTYDLRYSHFPPRLLLLYHLHLANNTVQQHVWRSL